MCACCMYVWLAGRESLVLEHRGYLIGVLGTMEGQGLPALRQQSFVRTWSAISEGITTNPHVEVIM